MSPGACQGSSSEPGLHLQRGESDGQCGNGPTPSGQPTPGVVNPPLERSFKTPGAILQNRCYLYVLPDGS
eukprot:4162594-Pyramimonas_sp.AAC.1